MRKDFVFHLYNVEHNNFMNHLAKCPEDLRKVVPQGFNTSLYWHLGHVLRITDFHVFGLSQQTLATPEHYKELFHYGTKATEWTEAQLAQMPEWDVMIEQLKEQREHIYNTLKDRLDESVPENFKKAENFGELILTTAAHLSNHNGVVAAMLQVLQQQK
ncbi:DinB family protein [Paenibacillus qinlingensis]|uniref:Glucosamine 6-phosphate synthetase-like amidotransferase/phosphosugar isomerase protein n=1 Tax=Paenibacillus qinlingensis TaxID=1837343 RepID=A0ABU1NTC5_9BACL|nr:DinB family protein [Paenibacillus qinlingensis]MDR6550117.1 glucosamine 6-phosphate synthetase-like amidotransferase/phosphosugar isomerase protein [Paenibacillus qinlingensis]